MFQLKVSQEEIKIELNIEALRIIMQFNGSNFKIPHEIAWGPYTLPTLSLFIWTSISSAVILSSTHLDMTFIEFMASFNGKFTAPTSVQSTLVHMWSSISKPFLINTKHQQPQETKETFPFFLDTANISSLTSNLKQQSYFRKCTSEVVIHKVNKYSDYKHMISWFLIGLALVVHHDQT